MRQPAILIARQADRARRVSLIRPLEMINMEEGSTATDKCGQRRLRRKFRPCWCVQIKRPVAPSENKPISRLGGIGQISRAEQQAKINAFRAHGQNQSGVVTIVCDIDCHPIIGLPPIGIDWNMAADQGGTQIEHQRRRPDQKPSDPPILFHLQPVHAIRYSMADLHIHTTPPPGAAADWTIPQNWTAFSASDHAMWDRLFKRQSDMLPGRAADAFLRGLDVLRLSRPGIPDYRELNSRLLAATGWQIVAVPGLVPDAIFFDHLANRRFPAGNFIRTPDQIDYLQEPDIFHDVFGHVPMLADPIFADYMVAYGKGGLRSLGFGALHKLARLYWYTVEFGLIKEPAGLRIYGAGIVSSYGESVFALDDTSPHRIGFDLARVMRTLYRIDDFQQTYFVISGLDHLLQTTVETDFAPLYHKLASMPDIGVADVLSDDIVISRGTQDHATHAQSTGAIAKLRR
jgi:phenylalanine-4-hydroxylase